MNKINIKPLSVNDAWQGRRFKTPKYKQYEHDLFYMLPNIEAPSGKFSLDVEVGYSSRASDIDNFLKPFLDVLQKKYKINDNNVYILHIEKKVVKKGEEYIKFAFHEL